MITFRPPGDKSIGHRALLLATLADGHSWIRGLSHAADVASTAGALRSLAAGIADSPEGVRVHGPTAFESAAETIDCGNSGTAARLLTGLVAGLGLSAILDGDASLRGRPMRRVVYPLQAMGARIEYLDRPERLPLRIHPRASGALRSLRHRPRVASAQVKSALLLAGVTARANVEIHEPGVSRDHTERMLAALGAPVAASVGDGEATVRLEAKGWAGTLSPLDLEVPGDPSSAAFMIAAALLRRESITVRRVGLNPTRTGFFEVLRDMGADVREHAEHTVIGEPVGEILVQPPARLRPFRISGELVPRVIDEIPVLAVLASRAVGRSRIEDAGELRVKESDRIGRMVANLHLLGVRCHEQPDGLEIDGCDSPLEGRIETGGDHRIAMAFAALEAEPGNRVHVDDPGCVEVSFPEFWEELGRITS
jgi:3-phosphoshikimate 1-carboxyvinyltransferase